MRKPTKSTTSIIEFKTLKAAAGGAGGAGGSRDRRFRAGEEVVCKVLAPVDGGYQIVVDGVSNPASLKSAAAIAVDEELVVQFLCRYKKRFLFGPLAG